MHRSRRIGRSKFLTLCVLISCGFSLLSCEDDYIYDDKAPTWLGSSIYGFLQDEGDYTNYVRIIDDLGYADVLNRTGSKTLFIADDDAFKAFFASDNKWGATKYEDLTLAQKKILLYNSMLDNAYLLDMMSSVAGNPPAEGSCLRQTTSASVYDSIPYFQGADLPANNKYWDAFRENGIRLALDNTDPMMTHFLKEYLTAQTITDEDFSIVFNGQTRSGDEAFVYGNKVLASGIDYGEYSSDTMTITCQNGYVYRMDGVLLPPSNMAEELRQNPRTQIFSRLLDRFAIPVYDRATTEEFNRLYHPGDDANSERVYVKRYVNSQAGTGHSLNEHVDESGNNIANFSESEVLPFDPGWNQYAASNLTTREEDMAMMLVPSDDVLRTYFEQGGGKFLVDRYGAPHYGEDWPLEQSLDSIPLNVIQAFLANLMKTSFVASVPSKFDKITNDARDPMGVTVAHVDECMLANNGLVYILNTVFGPAKYVAVSAPPLVQENMKIINYAITNSNYLLNYNSYLLAMDSYFSFIVPDDAYFTYYDPVTLEQDDKIMYTFRYGRPTSTATSDVVWAKKSTFNPEDYSIINDSVGVVNSIDAVMLNRLHDMMEYFIVVGDFDNGNKYHLAKGYGTVKVELGANGVSKIYGGEQLETGRVVNVLEIYDQTEAGNGKTYLTDGVPAPPTRSVYSVMDTIEEFSDFFELCNIDVESIISHAFPNAKKSWTDSIAKYSIFYKEPKQPNGRDFNVSFFNTFHYTVYAPTNAQMQEAYAQGLPRPDFWEEIVADQDAINENLGDDEEGVDYSAKIAAYLRLVNKFVRYHFQDNSVFVDNNPFSITEAGVTHYQYDYETAAINDKTGRFYNVTLETKSGYLTVTDQMGEEHHVVSDNASDEGRIYNIMARDMVFNNNNPTKATTINTSSFAVVHQLSGVLHNDGVGKNGSDGKWHYFAYDDNGNLVEE